MRIVSLILAAVCAAAAAAAPASAAVQITVDKSTQQMTVAVDGVPRWQWPVSTGRSGHDTPSGSFRAFRMEADHYSKEWDDAPMPNSIFFTKQGHAIHGYLDTKNIGNPASHGCVRLEPANAAKLYALVQQQGVLNTTVTMTGSIALARRKVPRQPADVAANDGGYQPVPLQPGYYRPQQDYYRQQQPTYYRQQLPPPPYGYRPPQSDYGPPPYEYRTPLMR